MSTILLKRVAKIGTIGTCATYGAGLISLYVDAPQADIGGGRRRDKEQVFPGWLHNVGRVPTVMAATAVSKMYLHVLNRLTCDGNEVLLENLKNRPKGKALLTVSNHTATVDDPGIFAGILPWSFLTPSRIRWSLCSQEYCYTKGRLASTLFYSAKTLPIKRGAGINQELLHDIFERIQDGQWVHIFPEGKITQDGSLGGREGLDRDKIGRLKWGVGKLIARADTTPVVIPIYHVNMNKLMPQDENNEVINVLPRANNHVFVRVGQPIDFEDLFREYEKERVKASNAASWDSEEKEKILYSAITRRIEEALLNLEQQISTNIKK
ncbi:hypothetical protein ABG067_007601 [Albugo candida]